MSGGCPLRRTQTASGGDELVLQILRYGDVPHLDGIFLFAGVPPYIPYSLGEGDNMVGCLMIGREVVGVAHVDMQGLRVRFFVYVKS
jgi:hypothetical protein